MIFSKNRKIHKKTLHKCILTTKKRLAKPATTYKLIKVHYSQNRDAHFLILSCEWGGRQPSHHARMAGGVVMGPIGNCIKLTLKLWLYDAAKSVDMGKPRYNTSCTRRRRSSNWSLIATYYTQSPTWFYFRIFDLILTIGF